MQQDDLQEQMRVRAFIQTQTVKELTGEPLWMKPESLEVLDRLLDKYMSKEPRDVETVAEVVGAFVGECLRKPLDALWRQEEDGSVRLVLRDGRALDPVERARQRLTRGQEQALGLYGEAALAFARDAAAPAPETVQKKAGFLKGLLRPGGSP